MMSKANQRPTFLKLVQTELEMSRLARRRSGPPVKVPLTDGDHAKLRDLTATFHASLLRAACGAAEAIEAGQAIHAVICEELVEGKTITLAGPLELLAGALESLAPAGEALDAALLDAEWLLDAIKNMPTVPDRIGARETSTSGVGVTP